jgi:hypothetical protein
VLLENLIWLAAGVGVGLFIAMIALAVFVLRDRSGFRRRLRAGRRAATALQRPREEPIIVAAAPVVQPAMVVDEPELVESEAAEPEIAVAKVEPEAPVSQEVTAVVDAPQAEVAAKPVPAEVTPVETATPVVAPEPIPAPEPAPTPEAPPRIGIQAAVAAALERRRAERAALAAAGQSPIVAPPKPLPPKAALPVRPAATSVRPTAAPIRPTDAPVAPADPGAPLSVEALFEKAFKTESPAVKPKDGAPPG